ncbi:haloacid dehalogenase type II [Guptibacillus algicola]|uniref:haloacid dehalogenase type II n=1 Tax=Guptibacillus algicola TaxID=225844 RepID=UPI001CD7C301|nr:haloacid dehalogenase type II [Alkalihalobacillus algicola]MCA0987664.1 haloacid dehalogenase type II [Alkalihalobacillus algicola]
MNIKAFVFDAYGTLFDVFSVMEKCEELFPNNGEAISQSWRKKQLEYSYLRQMMGKYRPFSEVTRDALRYAVAETGQDLNAEDEEALLGAYKELEVYEEVPQVLKELKEQNVTVAIFSNGSHDMLDPLVAQSPLSDYIDHIISADDVKQYKPTPASYTHVIDSLKITRQDVLFMSSNGWDISGAANFGFNTAWINRKEQPVEELNLQPSSIYHDLTGLKNWK